MSEDRNAVRADAIEKIVEVASKLTHAEWSRITQNVNAMFSVKATKRTLDSNDVDCLRNNLNRDLL